VSYPSKGLPAHTVTLIAPFDYAPQSRGSPGRRSRPGVASVDVRRRPGPVVVTDMHEPLLVVHRRMMRTRLILFAVWAVGWAVAGLLWQNGWLATTILLGSGPPVWLAVWAWQQRHRPGRREPVTPRPVRRRALPAPPPGRAGPGGAGGR
jgi:hypothetical protein